MKKLALAVVTLSLVLPIWAQQYRPQLSSEDQRRFDSYYSRWQQYRQKNDREQVLSMEKRMLDVYAHYQIPADTPFWRVASNGRSATDEFRGRLSRNDQERFDSYFSRWQQYRRENNREQVLSMEKRMQDVYAHYQIPSNTPYFWLASNAPDEDWNRGEGDRWRGRLRDEDQARFDDYYRRWLEYRDSDDRQGTMAMERRMRDLMDGYEIPPEITYQQIASPGAAY
jgi:hypothetical protein